MCKSRKQSRECSFIEKRGSLKGAVVDEESIGGNGELEE